MRATAPSNRYQTLLVGLLSLNFGIVFFDRNALNFLMPFVQPDLQLSNTQIGLLAAVLSLTWATAGFLIGRYSDRTGKRKSIIVWTSIAFSVCSFVSGLASSFVMLLGARLVMGIAEGGVLPISQSLVATEVSPAHRGLAMGVMQNMGSNLLGSAVAPLVLVAIAASAGWRNAFYLAALPGLIVATLIAVLVKEPARVTDSTGHNHERLSLSVAFGNRNVVLCALISILMVAHAVTCWTFMPLFLTKVRGYDSTTMGWLMATLGISSGFGGLVVAAVSDRVGRKPMMLLIPVISVILPLGALFFVGSTWLLAAIFFVGWGLNSLFPISMAAIPCESVDTRHVATVLGLVMGVGEVFGGVLGPSVAGLAADKFGLRAPMWILLGLCICCALLAGGLRETAPKILTNAT